MSRRGAYNLSYILMKRGRKCIYIYWSQFGAEKKMTFRKLFCKFRENLQLTYKMEKKKIAFEVSITTNICVSRFTNRELPLTSIA